MDWQPAMKLSDSASKTPNPGKKRVQRLYDHRGNASVDLVSTADESFDVDSDNAVYHPVESSKSRTLKAGDVSRVEDLHCSVFGDGRRLIEAEPLELMRERRMSDMERLDPGVLRLVNPHIYHVSLSQPLSQLRADLIAKLRGQRQQR